MLIRFVHHSHAWPAPVVYLLAALWVVLAGPLFLAAYVLAAGWQALVEGVGELWSGARDVPRWRAESIRWSETEGGPSDGR